VDYDPAAIEQIHANARPRVLAATSSRDLDYIAADATEAYAKESGLRRFIRQMGLSKTGYPAGRGRYSDRRL
jgi:hypothetical protein